MNEVFKIDSEMFLAQLENQGTYSIIGFEFGNSTSNFMGCFVQTNNAKYNFEAFLEAFKLTESFTSYVDSGVFEENRGKEVALSEKRYAFAVANFLKDVIGYAPLRINAINILREDSTEL